MWAREIEMGAREIEGEGSRNRELEVSKCVWVRGKLKMWPREVTTACEGGKKNGRGKSCPSKASPPQQED
jgi:hypothetical protein